MEKIAKLLSILLESTRANWSDELKKFAVKKLLEVGNEQKVCNLLEHLILTQKTPLSVAELLEKFGYKDNDFPSVDEAFKIALETRDDAKSVIVCDEIMQAWGVAEKYFTEGLKAEGKKAFDKEYTKLVEQARAESRKPKWWITYGEDKTLREEAEKRAIEMGIIKPAQAITYNRQINNNVLELFSVKRIK